LKNGVKGILDGFRQSTTRSIFDYHNEQVNTKTARKIIRQIVDKVDILRNFPEIGAVEEFLKNRPQNFRYLVITNYKIIYWVNIEKSRIEVADVFDTRQNPVKKLRVK